MFLIKSKLSVIAVIFFVLSLLFIVGCDLLNKNDDQPEITNEVIRDAYEKVVEAHAAKQVVLYNIISVYSNNYQTGQLFSYDPSYEELDTLLSQISALNDYKENIDYAVSIINSTQQNQKRYKGLSTYHPEGLGSAIAGFLVTSEPMSIHTKTNEDGTGTTVSGGGTERKAFGQLRVSLIDIESDKTMWIADADAQSFFDTDNPDWDMAYLLKASSKKIAKELVKTGLVVINK